LGKEEFQKKYARSAFDSVIRNTFEINEAKMIYYKYVRAIALKMISNKDQDGYKRFIAKKLGIDFDDIKIAEKYYEKECLSDILEQYMSKRMYKGDILETFKDGAKITNEIFNYANFLKQPLTLGMFVPCSIDGNVLEEPVESIGGVELYAKEYQQAKQRVLFKGFGYINVLNDRFILTHGGLIKYWIYSDDTIEGLMGNFTYNIELTETAIKNLGL